MVMVEYFADAPARTLGDFACALGCADTDVLAGDDSVFAVIADRIMSALTEDRLGKSL
jgi:hypothetical protein